MRSGLEGVPSIFFSSGAFFLVDLGGSGRYPAFSLNLVDGFLIFPNIAIREDFDFILYEQEYSIH